MNEALKILDKVLDIAKKAGDVAEYRALLAEAARKGDLDVQVATYQKTADDVSSFIDGGRS